jgi:hypothetical protein
MDQNPLPRGSLQVRDCLGEDIRTVPELPQTAVAVEAQYPAHPSGALIMVEVSGIGRATDGAPAALGGEELVELDLAAATEHRRRTPQTCGGTTIRTPGDVAEVGEREVAVALRAVLHIRFP